MSLTLDMVSAVMALIQHHENTITAMGSVSTVVDSLDVLVTFDGSSADIPCKVFGDVQVVEGDRVGLVKFGIWWCVVGTLARRYPSNGAFRKTQTTGGSTTSATFADTPDVCNITLTKVRDTSNLMCWVSAEMFTDVNATKADVGLKATDDKGNVSTLSFRQHNFNVINAHMEIVGFNWFQNLPAGVYDLRVQWRRASGTGTLTVDGNDQAFIAAMEVGP